MTQPKRYLFAIIDGGGTVPADTSVIRAMVERGHDVRVLAPYDRDDRLTLLAFPRGRWRGRAPSTSSASSPSLSAAISWW